MVTAHPDWNWNSILRTPVPSDTGRSKSCPESAAVIAQMPAGRIFIRDRVNGPAANHQVSSPPRRRKLKNVLPRIFRKCRAIAQHKSFLSLRQAPPSVVRRAHGPRARFCELIRRNRGCVRAGGKPARKNYDDWAFTLCAHKQARKNREHYRCTKHEP